MIMHQGDVSMVNPTGAAWPQLQPHQESCVGREVSRGLVSLATVSSLLSKVQPSSHPLLSLRWMTGFRWSLSLLFLHWLQQRRLGARFCLLATPVIHPALFPPPVCFHIPVKRFFQAGEKNLDQGRQVSWRYYHQTHSTDNLYTAQAYNRHL